MHYLIDGHNLIAQIPDIELKDPYDEAKLVLRLRSWVAAGGKRQVTVIFDGGLPGGEWRHLSRGRVKAIFASEGQTADALLMNRIIMAQNPSAFTLVTSDREILAQAKARRMSAISSEAFAQRLDEVGGSRLVKESRAKSPPTEDPILSQEEVDEWLELFGDISEEAAEKTEDIQPTQEVPSESDAAKKKAKSGQSNSAESKDKPEVLKSGTRGLSKNEVDEWLDIFGGSEPG